MKIITILGLISKNEEIGIPIYRYDDKLKGSFSLKRERYINMFSLLIDNFGAQDIVPIFTQLAKKIQIGVLKEEFQNEYNEIFNDRNFIDGEKDFYKILRIINDATSDDDKYIIDLTHGFRHIPILATISLISKSLSNTEKIKHIFFAKEIEPKKEYEIIDLKEYLELANMSYVLETFNHNYTVSLVSKFKNKNFCNLVSRLSTISNHILSNSLKALNKDVDKILSDIDFILKNEQIETFKGSLEDIQRHIRELQEIGKEKDSIKFYRMSRILNSKGYLLNAITLLFEAIGYYCAESFECFGDDIKAHINNFKNSRKFNAYDLTHESRTIVKKMGLRNGAYLTSIAVHDNIQKKLESIKTLGAFRDFIKDAEKLRNNLAHGNANERIEDSKQELSRLLDKYNSFCIQQNILGNKI
ncbi:TM1812 family CRISPR-associated protein [uncultured Campylobacter sp.]|mgnify:CR=1 FL=1|jgi:CRISPR-associated DxTHG motif protein|uniref:CRISPR-associated DxTHG motif protein n=1 Tax=uncultured Campylobacter sp. TaxID=218934 RepID=UPI0025DF9C48|nr:TM1812 family CRISPR-associated protein [uncultured Campylobacter sp.]